MYICDFSRSVGAGSATTRNTRGLTRSVIRRIVPPFPAVSRPSNTTQILAPVDLTHSCIATSSPCSRRISSSYSLRPRAGGGSATSFSTATAEGAEDGLCCFSFVAFFTFLAMFQLQDSRTDDVVTSPPPWINATQQASRRSRAQPSDDTMRPDGPQPN